jgi:hypothetical protein
MDRNHEPVALKHGCDRATRAIDASRFGFTLLGKPDEDGIQVVRDYFGPGMPRVVFEKSLA